MNTRHAFKAQSAMEYLMTYGWAILIIAVVLGALFSLGVFSSSSFLGTACIPQSGFLCSNPIATATGLTVTVGQATGSSWSSVVLCFVPTGTTVPSTCSTSGYSSNSVGSLASGQTVTATFPPGNGISTTLGTGFSGQIWATYTSASGVSNLMTQIGTVTVKVS
ncbi:MAG: hypothetical protein QXY86_02930 [Candidatus Micrarchaeaceae archaeon]